ncbi:SRPBCC family protein [Salegentibacter sp. F188]|uniref:SRPBCC family protein n=1 Tax=Autumnicola patrickiae TaxID=3075591 RepID=A0ABU3E2C1_9FLAO|nr:SRPBCC family protein [Salegentibacter sp. F188]MDT0690139.1 SRPBCC family protein [Salegentibacter sp. F188]
MQKYGRITSPGTVKFERTFQNKILEVWNYLTDSDKRGLWLASGNMQLEVGGEVKLVFQHRNLSMQEDSVPEKFKDKSDGETLNEKVVQLDPPEVLGFTWNDDSLVTFELSSRENNTHLLLTHENLGKNQGTLIAVCSGWHAHLNILSDRLEGLEPKGFWTTYNEIEAEYVQRIAADD